MKSIKKVTAIDLSMLLDQLPGSVYCKDLNGVYLGCNQFMAHIAGLDSPADVIGKTDNDMPWREQVDALRIIDQFVITSGETKTLEETAKLANGTWVTYLTTKQPLRDKKGKIIGVYGLSVDITKYKHVESKLLQENKNAKSKDIFSNLDQIIACMPGSVYWKDSKGIYRGCNNEVLAALGFSSMREIIGKTDNDIAKILGIKKEVLETIRKVDQEVITTGVAKLNVEELPFHFGDGKIVNQLTNKVPLRDENNHVVGLVGVSIDVSELKKQEVNFLEQIFACMPGSVYWKDRSGVYKDCNDELAKLVNVSKSEIVNKTDRDLGKKLSWSEEVVKNIIKIDNTIMESGLPRLNYEELPFHFADGKTINQLSNKVPLRDKKGDVIGIVGVSIDITERKKMEESLRKAKEAAEAASQAKSAFLENMRHDLRTPLTGIVGFARLIESEVTNPTIKEYADNLASSSESLLNIINEILDAIHLASGTTPIQKKKFSLKEKLQSIINLNQAKANEKKLILSLDYDVNIPNYLIGDYRRIQRVLLELLANALKFTEKGSVKITAKIEKQDAVFPIIKLTVSDTGIGIPENKQEEIFGSFNRLHQSHQGIFQGIGLGLTIVRQFIDDLRGEIYVESNENKGSTFICILPLQVALLQDDSYVSQTADTLVLKSFSLPKNVVSKKKTEISQNKAAIKILIVEDNDIAVKVVSAILKELGCQVDVAKNGHLAIDSAKSNTYDLIFMDVGLPDMDGNEVTRAIRDWENQFDQHTPVIGLTAHVEAEDKQSCVQAGMDAVLSKPLKPEMAEDLLIAFIPKFSAGKKIEEVPKTIFTEFGLPEKEEELFELPKKFIDFDMLMKTGDREDWSKEILPVMLADIEVESKKIRAAYTEQDWKTVQALTHKLKGGALCCGTVRLEKACFYLERYLKAGGEKSELKEALYQQLLKVMAGTIKVINKWIKA